MLLCNEGWWSRRLSRLDLIHILKTIVVCVHICTYTSKTFLPVFNVAFLERTCVGRARGRVTIRVLTWTRETRKPIRTLRPASTRPEKKKSRNTRRPPRRTIVRTRCITDEREAIILLTKTPVQYSFSPPFFLRRPGLIGRVPICLSGSVSFVVS